MNQDIYKVTSAPNASKISGKIVEVSDLRDAEGCVWKIKINDSLSVDDLPNFAAAHSGETISVYVTAETAKKFKKNDLVEACIFFQGDERSGAFFLSNNEVRKR